MLEIDKFLFLEESVLYLSKRDTGVLVNEIRDGRESPEKAKEAAKKYLKERGLE